MKETAFSKCEDQACISFSRSYYLPYPLLLFPGKEHSYLHFSTIMKGETHQIAGLATRSFDPFLTMVTSGYNL